MSLAQLKEKNESNFPSPAPITKQQPVGHAPAPVRGERHFKQTNARGQRENFKPFGDTEKQDDTKKDRTDGPNNSDKDQKDELEPKGSTEPEPGSNRRVPIPQQPATDKPIGGWLKSVTGI